MAKSLAERRFCKLSSDMVEDQLDTYTELVSKPKFFCLKCFRVSRDKQNLCRPKKLKKKKKKKAKDQIHMTGSPPT